MASWMVHLRIADELLPHLKNIDETAFVMGNMAPDSGVPNEDWTQFHPPTSVSHFKRKAEAGSVIDIDAFCESYFNDQRISRYSLREYSFFLGYYCHLLTDIRWSETVVAALQNAHPEECAADRNKLIETAKEDWYDLDFLYLERHPDFRTFSLYENAKGFKNEFMDIFSQDAFEDRRRYICGFYRSDEHGDLHREYRYLTPEEVNNFVAETVKWILELIAAVGSRRDAVPQEPRFYHGSIIKGLNIILANARSHTDGSMVAYFTTDRVYALVCCRSRQENFVTMGPRDGVQHYFERFPDQLRVLYEGKEGFLYRPVSPEGFKNTKGNTWESPVDVPVVLHEHIPDVYAEILREETAGNVIIHRYIEIDPAEQKMHANYIRDHLDDPLCTEYRDFLLKHFSSLWDQ
ncbi:MAG: zinc dependent phospholipase C family protein [Lachnospiraceae bacterium]|nr:zinc dependent phospholipase C family protein [Lachnospiraceae bacterium]